MAINIKWEYKWYKGSDINSLNQMGADRWEAVFATLDGGTVNNGIWILFKRERPFSLL